MAEAEEQPAWDQERVRALRGHLGYTQGEMAREMGIRQQTVSEWETGAYRPRGSSSTLLRIIAERAGFSYSTGGGHGESSGGHGESSQDAPTGPDAAASADTDGPADS